MRNSKVMTMTIAGLLSAMGIVIPLIAPRIVLDPASYTLASHVPIFIAMFISPVIALAVAIITTLGFLIGGFLPIIVIRASTHVIFAFVGALILKKNKTILHKPVSFILFVVGISVLHGFCEYLVATPYYFSGNMTPYEQKGYLYTIVGLVGVGTVIHSIVDFIIAYVVWKPVCMVVNMPVSFRFNKK